MTSSTISLIDSGDIVNDRQIRESASSNCLGCGLNGNVHFAKAMLPFCSRSTRHIVECAESFAAAELKQGRVPKIFLPLKVAGDAARVEVVGCAQPGTAVDYIRTWLNSRRAEAEEWARALASSRENEPYLLILSPMGNVGKFLGEKAAAELQALLDGFNPDSDPPMSDEYRVVADYYRLALRPSDNWAFRKILHHEGSPDGDVDRIITDALAGSRAIQALEMDAVTSCLATAVTVKGILEGDQPPSEQASTIVGLLGLGDVELLARDLQSVPLSSGRIEDLEAEAEAAADQVGARATHVRPIELMTIVGAKGLSAQHVMVLGCDNVNMSYVNPEAFFVAITRPRFSLHLLVALQARGAAEPHRYLGILDREHTRYSIYKKTGRVHETCKSWRALSAKLAKISYASRAPRGRA